MSKHVSRGLRVLFIAGLCALLPAAVASAASFKNGNGSLTINKKLGKSLKKGGVKAPKSASFSYSSATSPFIQINMVNGQATSLHTGATLVFKAGKTKAKLTDLTINGSALTGKVGGKKVSFPLTGGTATAGSTRNNGTQVANTTVSVTGVSVAITKADAKALNKALSKKGHKVNAFKKGSFGTLSFNGKDRQLIEIAGSGPNSESLTCQNNSSAAQKDQNNKILVSVSGGANPDLTDCTSPGYGATYPTLGSGVVDGVTGFGHVDVAGTVTDTCEDTTHTYCSPGPPNAATAVFSAPEFILSASPTVSAETVLGRETVLTVQLTSVPSLTETTTGASLSVPSSNLFFNAFTAGSLNTTFNEGPGLGNTGSEQYCPTTTCTTPDLYATSRLTVQFK